MTASALLRRSDLKRMADIAKSEGVRVSIEIDGRIISISPDIHKPVEEDTVAKGKRIRL
ncbi:hypothetical protein [Rhizobium leguminosarum]|uniref:hypothetical protein n=1 Tax=Rhizobium leguminosarum TaxID=384 RepID=UPI00197D9D84|nr:hypothetical protein [Rhizobium leguminosarum]